MAESKFERDMLKVRQHWNNFISLISQDCYKLKEERNEIGLNIISIERAIMLLQHSVGNIEYLLSHKDSIVSLDESLESKFRILESFKKINNLSNDVAIRTFNEILKYKDNSKIVENLEQLKSKKEKTNDEIFRLESIINENIYDIDFIIEYAKNKGLGSEALSALIIYPAHKLARKEVLNDNKKEEFTKQDKITNDTHVEVEVIPSEEPIKVVSEEVFVNYKDYFDSFKTKYEELIKNNQELINKYYVRVQGMTTTENQYYRVFCSLNDAELKKQIKNSDYNNAKSKILAIKIFDDKNEIEKLLKSIPVNNYINGEDVELLGIYVDELKDYISELKLVDDKLAEFTKVVEKVSGKKKTKEKVANNDVAKENEESFQNPKVFFLTDNFGKPFISDQVYEKNYQGSVINLINKAQNGELRNIVGELKISRKNKELIGKTVYTISNYKIVASFVNISMSLDPESNVDGVMILDVSLLQDNDLERETNAIISKNIGQLSKQIVAIEKGNPQQIGLQMSIRDELLRDNKKVFEEGEFYGRN